MIDIVTLSEVRKELLLYLNDGPRSLSEIREQFDITSPEVSPRIKELVEHNLIKLENKKYYLTPMGKAIITNFIPFINTINTFSQYEEFWNEHDLTSIPEEFLYRIGEIKNYLIIEDYPEDMDHTWDELYRIIDNSKSFVGISCVFNKTLPGLCVNATKNNTPMSIIITEKIYETLKKNFNKEMNEYIGNRNSALYVIDDGIKISHAVTDNCLFFSLYNNNGKFDSSANLISYDPLSVKWGRDLYEYYLDRSVKIG